MVINSNQPTKRPTPTTTMPSKPTKQARTAIKITTLQSVGLTKTYTHCTTHFRRFGFGPLLKVSGRIEYINTQPTAYAHRHVHILCCRLLSIYSVVQSTCVFSALRTKYTNTRGKQSCTHFIRVCPFNIHQPLAWLAACAHGRQTVHTRFPTNSGARQSCPKRCPPVCNILRALAL